MRPAFFLPDFVLPSTSLSLTFDDMPSKNDEAIKSPGKIVAIDGPAGSGKSTTAKLLAAKLGYRFLDTGAMYRALTLLALEQSIPPSDSEQLAKLAGEIEIEFETHQDVNRVFLDGREITAEIRTPEVTKAVSEVSAHAGVRKAMVAKQKKMGAGGSVVAEGRDTTTVVFPEADLKIYLQADVATRAQRRLLELTNQGVATTHDNLVADIERRDAFDSGREHSPLQKADDAHVIDTTDISINEQVEKIYSLLQDS